MAKVYSTIVYISIFWASVFCSNKAEKKIKYKKKRAFITYSIISVFIPCFLASVRGNLVGTDTIRYIWVFESANEFPNFLSYLGWTKLQGLEIGYSFVMYALAKMNFSSSLMLFVMELIIILPVYIIAYYVRNKVPMGISMLTFLTLFYNPTYNLTRQCMALSLILCAYLLLTNRKIFWGVVFCLVSTLFHNSAFIGILFIVCGLLFRTVRSKGIRQLFMILFFIIVALSPFFMQSVTELLYKFGVISERNSFYNTIFSAGNGVEGFTGLRGNGYISILMRLLLFTLPFFALRRDGRLNEKQIRPLVIINLIGTVFYISAALAFKTVHVYRITYYAEYFLILYFSLLYKRNERGLSIRTVAVRNILYYVTLWGYWFLTFIYWNYHQTSDYFMLLS